MRGAVALGTLVWAAALSGVRAQGQSPFRAMPEYESEQELWNFEKAPPANETAHLVFSTVQNLLQHWPNTRYRNGHTIVPSTIPIGTLLYHGTSKNALPTVPEWTATDPEHSFLFCRSLSPDAGCWHLTLVATRPLRVLYFDGSSAAKMYGGPMDSQDLVTWGEVRPERTFDERGRIRELCEWGKEFGIDGYARMEMDFEIMLCDFTAGVDTVSLLNLAAPDRDRPGRGPRPPPTDYPAPSPPPAQSGSSRPALVKNALARHESGDEEQKFPTPPANRSTNTRYVSPMFRVIEAGSWHNHFPGETRLKVDYAHLISFYDPLLFPSLVRAREGQTRLEHRLDGLSKEDSAKFRVRLEEVFTVREGDSGSGVEWSTLLNTVSERFAERLELLTYILNVTNVRNIPESEAETRMRQAHRHITSMVAYYTLHSSVPPSARAANHAWAAPVFEQCATTHTRYLDALAIARGFTPAETMLLNAVKGVQKEVCRVLVGLWSEGVELGMNEPDGQDARAAASRASSTPAKDLAKDWTLRIEGLMAWLDWSYWLRCRPACSYEEMCYLPTWPFFKNPPARRPGPGGPSTSKFAEWVDETGLTVNDDDRGDNDWEDPQPRCIRRVEPLELKFHD